MDFNVLSNPNRPVTLDLGSMAQSEPRNLFCSLLTVKYCFPCAGRGFADETFMSYKTSVVEVASPCDHCVGSVSP